MSNEAGTDRHLSELTIAKTRRVLWSLAALMLLAPAVAMLFTAEVRWGAGDFLLFAAMLLVAGGLVELAVRISRHRVFVLGAVLIVGLAFLLLWAELAVGLIGG